MRSPRSCSSVDGSASKPAVGAVGRAPGPRSRSPRSLVGLADLERAALEQRVDHLEQEERVAADLRQEVGAHLPRAVAHAEARLDEAHLLLGRQAAQLDAHDPLEQVAARGRPAA